MSFYFYLSYAPADYSEDLPRFFEDLTRAIRAGLGQSGAEPVGFFNLRGTASGSDWPTEMAEALRTSQTLVALMSPEYFRSANSGKEWQIFEMRRHLGARLGSAEASAAIAPVIWIPCNDNIPTAVSNNHDSLGHWNGAYRRSGLLMLRKSLDHEYEDTLVALAQHIIGVARTAKLAPLEVLPTFEDVDNAFNSSDELSASFTDQVENGRSKVIVVESHQQVREMLVEYLSSDFEVESYKEAHEVPDRILENESQTNPTDLFVVDLEFEVEGNRNALDLIGRIKGIKTKPAVMAMSASLSSQNLIEAMKMGAEDVVPKPFHIFEIMPRMKQLAAIGRNRRLYRPHQSRAESKGQPERERPVFLSYSSRDNASTKVAIFLKSNMEARGIGVWYSEEMQPPDDPRAAELAFEGLEKARVFIPLITNAYPRSTPCLGELIHFFSHPRKDQARVLLPVLHGSIKEIANFDWIAPSIGEHRNLTDDQFLDDLIALLGWIQKAVNRTGNQSGPRIESGFESRVAM